MDPLEGKKRIGNSLAWASLHHRPQRMLTKFIKHIIVFLYARRLRKETV